MPDNSTDIESDNAIKRYQRRPRKLENVCLADFVAWFNCVRDKQSDSKTMMQSMVENTCEDFIPETDFEDNVDDDPCNEDDETDDNTEYQLRGGMKLVKRRRPKIIRSVRFNKEKDPENYCREQLMLYVPWRNEEKDLIKNCQTYQERYNQVKSIIQKNQQQYECHASILDKAAEDLNDNDISEPVAPNTQHTNDQDVAEKTKPSELFGCFDPGANKQHNQYDLFDDMGILPRSSDDEELLQNRLSDNDYRQLVR